ncbi:MAG: acetate/propionate family kinase, partial [Pseudomonadota bacterium]|nr:acetate/propionate family kinase [Pseudomonadota bacterium]
GLSYSFLMETLEEKYGPRQASGRVILAHLGSGASLAAVHHRQCVDTSMGMTPAGGLVMGTRSGDLDPGLMLYFLQHEQLKPSELNDLINHGSGLLGVSGTTSDMRDLLQMEPTDSRAKEAIALFCYQARKWTGAFAAALNGLDSLVFSGGIGEHCAVVRSRICEGLGYLGVRLDERRNAADDEIISSPDSDVMVYVLPTDEERMIARQACRLVCDEMDQNKGES